MEQGVSLNVESNSQKRPRSDTSSDTKARCAVSISMGAGWIERLAKDLVDGPNCKTNMR